MGGTGLGLAIVKHLVKAHGWQILIESREGKGTKIRIMIPEEHAQL
jgi:two-component system phosphate regulon sensor histidine kinase PhoR